MARPLKPIDESHVFNLAQVGCSDCEIAALIGCHVDTIRDRFSTILAQGRNELKEKLRRKQIQVAMKGNPTMLQFLGKNLLGQTDASKVEVSGSLNISDLVKKAKE